MSETPIPPWDDEYVSDDEQTLVNAEADNGWVSVESESREDVTHGLRVEGGEAVYCTCEAYEYYKGPCKHVEQFNEGDSQ
jgi:hypothetical protein